MIGRFADRVVVQPVGGFSPQLPRQLVPEPARLLEGTRHLQDTALVEEEVADSLQPSGQPRPETHRAMVQWLRGDT